MLFQNITPGRQDVLRGWSWGRRRIAAGGRPPGRSLNAAFGGGAHPVGAKPGENLKTYSGFPHGVAI